MIDLAEIVEKIQKRLTELDTTAAVVSAKATDSKDTIRNWARAVEADRKNGTRKASATTIKLNQVEAALGIELARNGGTESMSSEAQLRSALLAFGVDKDELTQVVDIISTFVHDEKPEESPSPEHSQLANHRRAKAPFG